MSEKGLQYTIKFKESVIVILLKYFMIADAIDFPVQECSIRIGHNHIRRTSVTKFSSSFIPHIH